MNPEWYYVENDTTIGPATLADVAEKFRGDGGEPFLVWTEGMSDWADVATVPAISKLLQSKSALPSSVRWRVAWVDRFISDSGDFLEGG